jgi:hypothetical protein
MSGLSSLVHACTLGVRRGHTCIPFARALIQMLVRALSHEVGALKRSPQLLREPPCFNSLPTRAHAHTHTRTRAHSHAHAHVRAQSNSDWKSARSKWFNELLGFCDGFHFNGLEILEDKVSFVWGLGFMGQLPPSPPLPSSPPSPAPPPPPLAHTQTPHTSGWRRR